MRTEQEGSVIVRPEARGNQLKRIIGAVLPTDAMQPELLRNWGRTIDLLEMEPLRDWSMLDGIVVLGARMEFNTKRNMWTLPTMVDTGNGAQEFVGGKSRAVAAKQIVAEGFTGPFLVTGGTQYDEQAPPTSRAKILADEIKRRSKEATVIAIGHTGNGNTLGNITDTVHYVTATPDRAFTQLGILTNEWHMPRALLQFMSTDYFPRHGIAFTPVVVEDVLRRQRGYEHWAEMVDEHQTTHTRLQDEVKGITDFLRGSYRPRSH